MIRRAIWASTKPVRSNQTTTGISFVRIKTKLTVLKHFSGEKKKFKEKYSIREQKGRLASLFSNGKQSREKLYEEENLQQIGHATSEHGSLLGHFLEM